MGPSPPASRAPSRPGRRPPAAAPPRCRRASDRPPRRVRGGSPVGSAPPGCRGLVVLGASEPRASRSAGWASPAEPARSRHPPRSRRRRDLPRLARTCPRSPSPSRPPPPEPALLRSPSPVRWASPWSRSHGRSSLPAQRASSSHSLRGHPPSPETRNRRRARSRHRARRPWDPIGRDPALGPTTSVD